MSLAPTLDPESPYYIDPDYQFGYTLPKRRRQLLYVGEPFSRFPSMQEQNRVRRWYRRDCVSDVRTQIMLMNPPLSFDQAYAMVDQAESMMKTMHRRIYEAGQILSVFFKF